MPTKSSIADPWKSFFSEVDASLTEEVALHCLGGFVMTMVHQFDRLTVDVDVLPVASNSAALLALAGQGSKLHRKYKIYLQIVGVTTVPENYEERLTEMFPATFNYLRLLALDPYDLALSKLERNAPRDREDFSYLARTVPLDFTILRERYEREQRPYLATARREDLTLELWIQAGEEERQLRETE